MHYPEASNRSHSNYLQKLAGVFARKKTREPFASLSLAVGWSLPVRFVCSADLRLSCVAGTAWITAEADTRDVVLEVGQVHVANHGDRLFINGLPSCKLHIDSVSQVSASPSIGGL